MRNNIIIISLASVFALSISASQPEEEVLNNIIYEAEELGFSDSELDDLEYVLETAIEDQDFNLIEDYINYADMPKKGLGVKLKAAVKSKIKEHKNKKAKIKKHIKGKVEAKKEEIITKIKEHKNKKAKIKKDIKGKIEAKKEEVIAKIKKHKNKKAKAKK